VVPLLGGKGDTRWEEGEVIGHMEGGKESSGRKGSFP